MRDRGEFSLTCCLLTPFILVFSQRIVLLHIIFGSSLHWTPSVLFLFHASTVSLASNLAESFLNSGESWLSESFVVIMIKYVSFKFFCRLTPSWKNVCSIWKLSEEGDSFNLWPLLPFYFILYIYFTLKNNSKTLKLPFCKYLKTSSRQKYRTFS